MNERELYSGETKLCVECGSDLVYVVAWVSINDLSWVRTKGPTSNIPVWIRAECLKSDVAEFVDGPVSYCGDCCAEGIL